MAWIFTIVCLAALAVLLYAEARLPDHRRLPKMVASSSFVAVALATGALDTRFGQIMMVGLVLSWFGDLFLSYSGRSPFVAGLAAFLAAHIGYVVAFAYRGLGDHFVVPLLVMVLVAIPVARWLLPTVPRELKPPIILYIAVISIMVAAAAAANTAAADWRIPAGAIAFYLSDLGVARDRFTRPGLINRIVGLPLYFGSQLLLAWAAGG